MRQHDENEKAFYAIDAWDIEVNLNELGWTEIAGLHDRGTYDLRNSKLKGKHVLEISIGIDRLLYSILDSLYETKQIQEGKPILKIPYCLATIQVSVLPLMNKTNLHDKATEVYQMLKNKFKCEFNNTGSIGKRYLKNAIKGIPYSVTIDYETLEDVSVTVRDRDTEQQDRVKIVDLTEYLSTRLYN